jgi:glyoxylase-like metal-dependent hydrolase (beta-lactamase superfamily II)
MLFPHVGQVEPGFFVLGSAATPSYLLAAPRPVLFDAGFACLGHVYAGEARQFLNGTEPDLLCLTHVHFDHCGSAAYLKKAFPGLKIAASARAGEILSRPNALDLIGRLNQQAVKAVRAWSPELVGDAEFAPFALDLALEDGQEIDLGGGLTLQVLATPGHTSDFLSYHIPERGILVASEAVGCADMTDYVVTEFLVDYEAYMASMERLRALKPRILCQGHRLVYTGDDVERFLERSFNSARAWVAWVEGLLRDHGGEVEPVVALVKAGEYDPRPQPKQPEPAYLLNLRARVRHLAARLGYTLE